MFPRFLGCKMEMAGRVNFQPTRRFPRYLNLVSERASDPSQTRYGLQHPRKDCRGQVGDS